MDEGYIKFNCNWINKEQFSFPEFEKLNEIRTKLFNMGLIGIREGIGYGNISVKAKEGFIITGSATGKYPKLGKEHFSKVIAYSFMNNSLTCKGGVKASSESLTHAAVYEADKSACAVIHIHSLDLWNKLINKAPTTKEVPYGTPQMAYEILRLIKTGLKEKIIIMAGHKEGILSFGFNLDQAFKTLINYLD